MNEQVKAESVSFLADDKKESAHRNRLTAGKTSAERVPAVASVVCGAIIIASTFLSHFLTAGVSFSVGVYYVTFLEAFGQSNGLTAWIGSLNFGSLCAAGPLASVLINRHGCCVTLMVGGILSAFGLLLSGYATNIYVLFATYGVIAGAGFGLVFTASISVITYEFDRWRTFAMGLSMSGVGLGTCIQPFLANKFIAWYGWRGALMLTSALSLHACALALLIRLVSKIAASSYETTTRRKIPSRESQTDKNVNSELHMCSVEVDLEGAEFDVTKSYCSFAYVILHINVILYCFGQSVIYTHIVSYAHHRGHPLDVCSTFVSIIGISNVLGRIFLGILSQHPVVNITVLYSLCYVIAGISSYGYCVWDEYVVMAMIMALIGFSLAAFGPLLSEVVYRIVGVDRFASAYGFLMISMATGTLLGAPSAGWLFDVTQVYEYSFYLGGLTFVLSGVIMALPTIFYSIRSRCSRKNDFLETY